MNFSELEYIATVKEPPKYSLSEKGQDGFSHPLLDILNNRFKPDIPWKKLNGAEKEQVRKAAHQLDEHRIPYWFYANFLDRFKKGYLKNRGVMLITGYKEKKSGVRPILSDYLSLIEYLLIIFKDSPSAIKLNDYLYSRFPYAYDYGVLKYTYSVSLINNALMKTSAKEVMKTIVGYASYQDVHQALGTQTLAYKPVDLSAGSKSEMLKILQKELRIRTGKESGMPNIELNKYFTRKGVLNAKGLSQISQ